MKKYVALLLSLMMILALPLTAMAASRQDYVGEWLLIGVEENGYMYDPEDLGVILLLCLQQNGRSDLYDAEGCSSAVWTMRNGNVVTDGVTFCPTSDGLLYTVINGCIGYFAKLP